MKRISIILLFALLSLRIYAQDAKDSTTSIFSGSAPMDKITFVNTDEFNDFENVFTPEEESELKKIMYENKNHLYSIVTTQSYEPYEDIKQYAYAFGESLQFNKANLVVFALCKNKLGFYILAGSKVQVVLTPEKLKQIMDEVITPEFQDGDFYLGIKNAIIAISKL